MGMPKVLEGLAARRMLEVAQVIDICSYLMAVNLSEAGTANAICDLTYKLQAAC